MIQQLKELIISFLLVALVNWMKKAKPNRLISLEDRLK